MRGVPTNRHGRCCRWRRLKHMQFLRLRKVQGLTLASPSLLSSFTDAWISVCCCLSKIGEIGGTPAKETSVTSGVTYRSVILPSDARFRDCTYIHTLIHTSYANVLQLLSLSRSTLHKNIHIIIQLHAHCNTYSS